MLHLMLANDASGFACGEVHGLFRPIRLEQLNRRCSCGYTECKIWPPVHASGEHLLYPSLFDKHPNIDFIVDSSKQPFWVLSQHRYLRERDIPFCDILVWKTPLELAESFRKRGRSDWLRVWLSTYRNLLTMFPNIRGVKYRDLLTKEHALRDACHRLGIPYFNGKENYWNRTYCLLGGSRTARSHLHRATGDDSTHQGTSGINTPYQTLTYTPVVDRALQMEVQRELDSNTLAGHIERLLSYIDVSNKAYDYTEFRQRANGVSLNRATIFLKRAKYQLRVVHCRYKFRNVPYFSPTPQSNAR